MDGQSQDARLDIRLSSTHKEIIEMAACISGVNVTQFVIDCCVNASKTIIENQSNILMTVEDKKIFIEALSNPAKPSEKLIEAMRRYNEFEK